VTLTPAFNICHLKNITLTEDSYVVNICQEVQKILVVFSYHISISVWSTAITTILMARLYLLLSGRGVELVLDRAIPLSAHDRPVNPSTTI
jgi:hypothetical protein